MSDDVKLTVEVPRACLLTCASLLRPKWPTMADTLEGFANPAPTEHAQGDEPDICGYRLPPTEAAPMGERPKDWDKMSEVDKREIGRLYPHLRSAKPSPQGIDVGDDLPAAITRGDWKAANRVIERQAAEIERLKVYSHPRFLENVVKADEQYQEAQAEIKRLTAEIAELAAEQDGCEIERVKALDVSLARREALEKIAYQDLDLDECYALARSALNTRSGDDYLPGTRTSDTAIRKNDGEVILKDDPKP